MEVDPKSPCDVEMPASMKRGLLSEFDNSSGQKSFGESCFLALIKHIILNVAKLPVKCIYLLF